MQKAISLHSIVPVRSQAAEQAEQTTQMLFAELCSILEVQDNWTKVRLDNDRQEGWVDSKMIAEVSKNEYKPTGKARVKFPIAYAVSMNNRQTIPLTAGTYLPNYKDGTFNLLGVQFGIDSNMVAEHPMALTQESLLETVRFFLNIPYLWGGKNALGMDCSGFSQTILGLFGKKLLRNASEQAQQGIVIEKLEDAQAGDLAFFDHADIDETRTSISHVGILIDKERIIHCSGRVKIEKIDNHGIYNAEFGKYTHHLTRICRY